LGERSVFLFRATLPFPETQTKPGGRRTHFVCYALNSLLSQRQTVADVEKNPWYCKAFLLRLLLFCWFGGAIEALKTCAFYLVRRLGIKYNAVKVFF